MLTQEECPVVVSVQNLEKVTSSFSTVEDIAVRKYEKVHGWGTDVLKSHSKNQIRSGITNGGNYHRGSYSIAED